MALSCNYCGNPFCLGSCLRAQQYLNQQPMNDYQKYLAQYMNLLGGASSLGALGQAVSAMKEATPPKSLPEESVLCATGGIVAWREWRVPNFGEVLYSINGEQWPVRQPLKAQCKYGVTNCRGVACDCGIYGWKKRDDLKVNDSGLSCIRGEVWFWGKVIEHTLGYRAQFAYPKAFVRCVDAERLALVYGVSLI